MSAEHELMQAFEAGLKIGIERGRRIQRALTPQVTVEIPAQLPGRIEDLERLLIERAYHEGGGVKTKIAKLLGIKPGALYYKLHKYGIGTINHPKGRP